MNLRALFALLGMTMFALFPPGASAVLMNIDFTGRFAAFYGSFAPPVAFDEPLTGRFTLDYATPALGGGESAQYLDGVVAGAWMAGDFSGHFLEGPTDMFNVWNDAQGPRGSPRREGFQIDAEVSGPRVHGLVPFLMTLSLRSYEPYLDGIESIDPPLSLDLDKFGGSGAFRGVTLLFERAPGETASVEYALTGISVTPAMSVPEPATGMLASTALAMALALRATRRRHARAKENLS